MRMRTARVKHYYTKGITEVQREIENETLLVTDVSVENDTILGQKCVVVWHGMSS